MGAHRHTHARGDPLCHSIDTTINTRLRAEAERTQVPATTLAREAIDMWLRQAARQARHEAIAAYADQMVGIDLDLDPYLESAAIDHLVKTGKRPK